jgi:hypothetical protein
MDTYSIPYSYEIHSKGITLDTEQISGMLTRKLYLLIPEPETPYPLYPGSTVGLNDLHTEEYGSILIISSSAQSSTCMLSKLDNWAVGISIDIFPYKPGRHVAVF